MISFKNFLIESQNYPLFHGTHIDGLVHIITNNILPESRYSDADLSHKSVARKNTISTTRSKNFATYWSQRKVWATTIRDNITPGSVVIELDRGKLRNNYKIVPYNHFGAWSGVSRFSDSSEERWGGSGKKDYRGLDKNQYEERIVGSVRSINKYINKIYMSSDIASKLQDERPDVYNKIVKQGWLKEI